MTGPIVPILNPQFVRPWSRRPRSVSLASVGGRSVTPEELQSQIIAIKSVMVSGVESAAYGDKRTEFRSLAELREILNGLEEALEELLGYGGRTRQIRMTSQWDKGL